MVGEMIGHVNTTLSIHAHEQCPRINYVSRITPKTVRVYTMVLDELAYVFTRGLYRHKQFDLLTYGFKYKTMEKYTGFHSELVFVDKTLLEAVV